LSQTPKDVKVLQNQNGQITFELDDSTRYNLTWLFNGNPLELSNKYSVQTKVQINFNITKANVNDSGTYTAVIDNGIDKLVIPVKIAVQGRQFQISISNTYPCFSSNVNKSH